MTGPVPAAARAQGPLPVERPLTLVRSSVDFSHLLGFLAVLASGLVAGTVASQTAAGVAADLANAADRAPAAVVPVAAVLSRVTFLLVALGTPLALLLTRRARVVALGAAAATFAAALFVGVAALVPLGVGTAFADSGALAVPGGARLPWAAAIAAYAAGAVVAGTELTRRWTRALWMILAFVGVTQVVTATGTPLGLVVALGLGGAVGSGALLAFGRRVATVTPDQVMRALARTGIDALAIEPFADSAWPGWTLRLTTADGTLVARTVGVREQRADTLLRRYRRIRLKDVGDDDPYTSPRRAAAAESMMSLVAARNGVRCPALRACEPVGPEEFLLAVDHVPGRRLSDLTDVELTPDVLTDAWRQVAGLRQAGVAHRDLRLDQLIVDPGGHVWIRDFAFGEPAAADGSLEGDVAELLAGTCTRVGPQAAVVAAAAVLPTTVLAGAVTRLVPAALTRPTRAALKANPGSLEALVAEVCRVADVSAPVFAQVERLRPRTLVIGATLAVAVYILLPQLADLPGMLEAVRSADWVWVPAVAATSVLVYIGAGLGLVGATPGRLPVIQSMVVALAGRFVVLFLPGAVGLFGLNVRFLQKRGYATAVSVSASAAKETATVVVHVLLLLVVALWLGSNEVVAGGRERLPPAGTVLAVLGGAFGLVGVALASPALRRRLRQSVVPAARDALGAMAQVAASPLKMVMAFGGVALLPIGHAACLYYSVLAFGGRPPFAAVALVFLTVGALASAAPTPGGLGAVEAVLLGALVGLGIEAPEALAAVFLYRLATFWLPIAPGFVSFRWLTSRDML